MRMLIIPPTRTHRQLAAWINANELTFEGHAVAAKIEPSYTNTDRKIGRLRWPGKGRRGLKLTIWYERLGRQPVFEHDSSETYRRHKEARWWCETNLERKRRR